MEQQRRRALLKAGGSAGLLGLLAAAGFLPAGEALAQQQPWNAPAFSTKSVADTVRALGAAAPAANKAIEIKAAESKYTAWPPGIWQLFEPARTLKTGKPSYKLEQIKSGDMPEAANDSHFGEVQ